VQNLIAQRCSKVSAIARRDVVSKQGSTKSAIRIFLILAAD